MVGGNLHWVEVKLACKPGSVEHLAVRRQSFIWADSCLPARATYPGAARAALSLPYLVLLRMGFAMPFLLPETRWALTRQPRDCPHFLRSTHRFTIAVPIAETWADYSLWHFPSPRGVRPLTGILLCGARTFLCASELRSDCPASFGVDYRIGKPGSPDFSCGMTSIRCAARCQPSQQHRSARSWPLRKRIAQRLPGQLRSGLSHRKAGVPGLWLRHDIDLLRG